MVFQRCVLERHPGWMREEREWDMAKVLVVDDEPSIRTLLDTILCRKGHEVLLADRGTKALELYHREQPQLAILDFYMPEMDGIAVLERLRALNQNLPVIILTGMGTDASEKRAKELGVIDFLEKGFSLHRLGEALANALKQVEAAQAPGGPTRPIPSSQLV